MTELGIQPTELDCAYLAGLIDIGGRISIQGKRDKKSGRTYKYAVVRFNGLPREIEDWIRSHFPKLISGQTSTAGRLESGSISAAALLVHAHPYLQKKKAEAQIVFEFARTVRGTSVRIAPENEAKRAELEKRLSSLKRP